MAAGFFQRSLLNLSSAVTRWVEFADGSVDPVHGSVAIDPATGLPLDPSVPQIVREATALSTSGIRTTAGVLFKVSMGDFKSIAVQLTSLGVGGAVVFETSLDDINYVPVSGVISSAASTGGSSTANALGLYFIPRRGPFFQVRLTAITSGTVTVLGELSSTEASFPSVGVGGTSLGNTTDAASGAVPGSASMIALLKQCVILLEAIRVKP